MLLYASPSAWKESRHVRTRRLRKTAGLAGFEPATHGPGNRCRSSVNPRNAYFYAISAPSLLHNTTTIDCHKLSDRLPGLDKRRSWLRRGYLLAEPPCCWRG